MCNFCNRKTVLSKSGTYFHAMNDVVVAEGNNIALSLGVDCNNNLCLWATSEDVTEYYYPKYCPECGRKLSV